MGASLRGLVAALGGAIAFGGALGAIALLYRWVSRRRIAASTRIQDEAGIESLEAVELGGVQQWIYLRGQDRQKPLLLFLHGGPGSAEMPLARDFGLHLEAHFVVVHWDQRESGKSLNSGTPAASLTIDQYVSDTVELIELLRSRFGQERVYLVGHSWGTILGTVVARDRPELLHAYVGMGQVVDMRLGAEVAQRFVVDHATKTGNRRALSELSALVPPFEDDVDGLMVQGKWVYKFGGGVHDGSMLPFLLRGLLSPEYSLGEILSVLRSFGALIKGPLYAQMLAVDFLSQAPSIDVPTYFLVGRHDYNTPHELVERYCELLEAPSKEIIWFEHSAHMPNLEEPARFQEVLINKILPETFPGSDR